MDTDDLKYLDDRIKQVEEHLTERLDSRDQQIEKLAEELREEFNTLMRQLSQAMWITENCKDCQLCHQEGGRINECRLLRGNTK